MTDGTEDSPIPVTCPTCRYEANWLPKEQKFGGGLDMYPTCNEVRENLHKDPNIRAQVSGEPHRACISFYNEWARLLVAKNRERSGLSSSSKHLWQIGTN